MSGEPKKSMGDARPAVSGYRPSPRDFSWKRDSGGWALMRVGRRKPVLHVVPDETWAGMWRVRSPTGRLSDMANLSWARDAALAIALTGKEVVG